MADTTKARMSTMVLFTTRVSKLKLGSIARVHAKILRKLLHLIGYFPDPLRPCTKVIPASKPPHKMANSPVVNLGYVQEELKFLNNTFIPTPLHPGTS
jgi:hypothetical protein